MFDIASNLLSIPKQILRLITSVKTLQRDAADRTADLFRHISETLALVASEIREGQVPHGACAQLATFADEFVETTQGLLGEAKAQELAAVLRDNHNVEMLAANLASGETEVETAARQIEEASGRFFALAFMIRAKV